MVLSVPPQSVKRAVKKDESFHFKRTLDFFESSRRCAVVSEINHHGSAKEGEYSVSHNSTRPTFMDSSSAGGPGDNNSGFGGSSR